MRAAAALALAALAAAPRIAAAQFRPSPMTLRLPYVDGDVVEGRFRAATGGADLLVLGQGAGAELRPWRGLLRREASAFPIATLGAGRAFRAGHLPQAGGDLLADVASASLAGVSVVFGTDPATARSYPGPVGCDLLTIASFARMLPKPASPSGTLAEILVLPCIATPTSHVLLLDFDGAAVPAAASRSLPVPYPPLLGGLIEYEAFPVRLSAAARATGIDDVAIPTWGGALLLLHASAPPAGGTLADLDLVPVLAGCSYPCFDPSPWLPATVRSEADVLGVAALDVNQDGALDLVYSMNWVIEGLTYPGTQEPIRGELVWLEGTGDPADFASPERGLTPWHDLAVHPLLQLPDPFVLRALDLGGEASFAVWDRELQEVLVVTPDAAAAGGLRVWRAPAPGRRATDIRLADVAGSPAPDLLVKMWNFPSADAVHVYPDVGDQSPVLAWAPGSPGEPARGVDHAMAVEASDADGPLTLEWMIGDPYGAPVDLDDAYTHPGASLCGLPPPDLAVTVRATDDLGVFAELAATLPVALRAPAIALAGAATPGRLVLPPGGTAAVFEGTAAMACGAASWGGAWPPGATITDEATSSSVRRTVTLPEATYPDLLAGSWTVTLSTTDPVPDPVATLAIDLDATGLVAVEHGADRAALAEGEVAVLHTLLRSRVGVALPLVRVVDALSGLAPAGPPRVTGATVVESRAGGGEVVLDVLPASPAEVRIELPVVSVGGRGASAVEARSSGEYLLTPPAKVPGNAGALPGCGCGSAGAGAEALLAAALLLARRRPRPT